MAIRSVRDLDVAGRRVFTRVDFNCPITDGKVMDDSRIRAALPTIRLLVERGARVVLASHLGRPKGKRNPKYSLEPVAARLAELLGPGHEVVLADEPLGDGARRVVTDLRGDGRVAMLENLRFDPGEEQNDGDFARGLASLADVYVNDAFGSAHRAHASIVGITSHVQDKAAGLLLEREIEFLSGLLGEVERPYWAMLGGAKVSDKIGVLKSLLPRVDGLLIGGAMANTFLAVRGIDLGRSMVEQDSLHAAREILERVGQSNKRSLLLPIDAVVAESIDATKGSVVSIQQLSARQMVLDIGPRTVTAFGDKIAAARTIFWNGPMGVYEKAPFAEGTAAIARAVADSDALSVVGGGDSVAALRAADLTDEVAHVSTGGGASLEFIEGKELPGVRALQ